MEDWSVKIFLIVNCAMLPKAKKCKKVIVWSRDFGIDYYVLWCLPPGRFKLRCYLVKIWRFLQATDKWSESQIWPADKLQTRKQICWVSGIMQFKLKCLFSSTHHKQPVSCIGIYFVSFWKMRSCISKTITDSNIDLDKFPPSKVRQVAKKMESSKSTARHVKAVASDPQVPQVHLMCTIKEHTSCQASPSGNNNVTSLNKRRGTQVNARIKDHPLRNLIQAKDTKEKIDVQSVVTSKHVEGFKCPARKFQYKTCNKNGHFTSLCYKKQ